MPERGRRSLLAVTQFLQTAFPGGTIVAHDSLVPQLPAYLLLHVELGGERLIVCIVSELLDEDDPDALVEHLRASRLVERLNGGEPYLIVRAAGVERSDPRA